MAMVVFDRHGNPKSITTKMLLDKCTKNLVEWNSEATSNLAAVTHYKTQDNTIQQKTKSQVENHCKLILTRLLASISINSANVDDFRTRKFLQVTT